VSEVTIRLARPASLTPELRAWIGNRMGACRAVLTRDRTAGRDRGGLLLRIEFDTGLEAAEEELAELVTDLRLLGLRPTVLGEPVA
jgi:hypothetical protein